MSKNNKNKTKIDEQEDKAFITVNGFEVIKITNRIDEGFIEIHVYNTEKICICNLAFDAAALKLFEEED